MQTVGQNMVALLQDLEEGISNLFISHSFLKRNNYPGSNIIFAGGDYTFDNLKPEGKQLQLKLIKQYVHCRDLILIFTTNITSADKKAIELAFKHIDTYLQQKGWYNTANTKDMVVKLNKEFTIINTIFESLYSGEGKTILVPDTNALIFNPSLESWSFFDVKQFIILLTPTVLSELDYLKINNKSEEVREKAKSLITRIKGYRSRGVLNDGVPLVTGKSMIQSLAVEPQFDESLPWLDKDNNDDRIVASIIEVMRKYPQSSIVLVTGDINLQNKAEFAKIPFCEPPEII